MGLPVRRHHVTIIKNKINIEKKKKSRIIAVKKEGILLTTKSMIAFTSGGTAIF